MFTDKYSVKDLRRLLCRFLENFLCIAPSPLMPALPHKFQLPQPPQVDLCLLSRVSHVLSGLISLRQSPEIASRQKTREIVGKPHLVYLLSFRDYRPDLPAVNGFIYFVQCSRCSQWEGTSRTTYYLLTPMGGCNSLCIFTWWIPTCPTSKAQPQPASPLGNLSGFHQFEFWATLASAHLRPFMLLLPHPHPYPGLRRS